MACPPRCSSRHAFPIRSGTGNARASHHQCTSRSLPLQSVSIWGENSHISTDHGQFAVRIVRFNRLLGWHSSYLQFPGWTKGASRHSTKRRPRGRINVFFWLFDSTFRQPKNIRAIKEMPLQLMLPVCGSFWASLATTTHSLQPHTMSAACWTT